MSAALAFQKALRTRLVSTSAVTDLVPATNILDRNARPAPDPSIIIGEDQVLEDDGLSRSRERVFATVHIWKQEASLTGVKAIGSAIRTAIHSARLTLDAGFHCGDCHVSDMRFLRDPDGETSHGVVTVEAMLETLT